MENKLGLIGIKNVNFSNIADSDPEEAEERNLNGLSSAADNFRPIGGEAA